MALLFSLILLSLALLQLSFVLLLKIISIELCRILLCEFLFLFLFRLDNFLCAFELNSLLLLLFSLFRHRDLLSHLANLLLFVADQFFDSVLDWQALIAK